MYCRLNNSVFTCYPLTLGFCYNLVIRVTAGVGQAIGAYAFSRRVSRQVGCQGRSSPGSRQVVGILVEMKVAPWYPPFLASWMHPRGHRLQRDGLREGSCVRGVCVCLGDTSMRVSFSLPPSLLLSAPDWRSGGMSSGGSPVQSRHRGLRERYQTADGKLTV